MIIATEKSNKLISREWFLTHSTLRLNKNFASKLRNLKTAMTAHLIERFFLSAVLLHVRKMKSSWHEKFSHFLLFEKITQQWLTIWLRASKKSHKEPFLLTHRVYFFTHGQSTKNLHFYKNLFIVCNSK